MKYEIIIEPENKKHCGNCTYKKLNIKGNLTQTFKEWYCMLFDKILVAWNIYDKAHKPSRCLECQRVTTAWENMPELDES